jgi:hypothetical protein
MRLVVAVLFGVAYATELADQLADDIREVDGEPDVKARSSGYMMVVDISREDELERVVAVDTCDEDHR